MAHAATAPTTAVQAGGPAAAPVPLGRRSRAVGLALVLLAIFVIVLPKGGIKVSGVPLTWGYFLIAAFSPLALLFLAPPPRRASLAFTLCLPFIFLIVPIGIADVASSSGFALGWIFSVLLNFAVFPFVFYILFSGKMAKIPPRTFEVTLVWSIRAIAVYGIFLFIYKATTGALIEIPYLTVNAGDIGGLEAKNNDRGALMKLISTYNNGNIYGACLPMLLPVYLLFEKRMSFALVVWASLFLTISRTAWFGGFLLIFMLYFIGDKPDPKRIVRGTLVLVGGGVLVWWILTMLGRDLTFLFDPTMNGRVDKYDDLATSVTLLPQNGLGGFGEIPYLGVLKHYGIVAFLTFMPLFVGPVLLSYMGRQRNHPIRKAARRGYLTYLFMAVSDGAVLLIPVMAFFYMTTLLAMEGHAVMPAERIQPPKRRRRR